MLCNEGCVSCPDPCDGEEEKNHKNIYKSKNKNKTKNKKQFITKRTLTHEQKQ